MCAREIEQLEDRLLLASNWGQQAKLTPINSGPDFRFGKSVATDGDIAVVGQVRADIPGVTEAGSAVVFERTTDTDGSVSWAEFELTAADAATADRFGAAVAVSGDTAIVGAKWKGAAYVFERNGISPPDPTKCTPEINGNYWCEMAKLQLEDPGLVQGQFGKSVAIDGDIAVVGAPEYDDPVIGGSSGAAYVFVRNGTTWNATELIRSGAARGDYYGFSVDVSGETIIVGSIGAGSASVFERDEGGLDNWGETDKLTAGRHVAIDGDTAAVSSSGHGSSGGATFFVRGSGSWSEQAIVTVDSLASSVAIDGDTAVIGAQNDKEFGRHSGAAYVFVRDPTTCPTTEIWCQVDKLTANDAAKSQHFGFSVSISGDTALVGAYLDDNAAGTDAGAAYVFVKQAPVPGITVSPNSGLVTTEAGGTATFDVVLNTQPTQDVTIGISSSNLTEGTVDQASLTFTSLDWNMPQTVTVSSVDDSDPDGDVAYTVVTAAAVSTDIDYGGMDASDVSVINLDNEVAAGVTVTNISPASMPINSTENVVISGSGFSDGADVSFAGSRAPQASNILVVNTTQITATVTSHKKFGGLYDVIVTNLDGSSGVLPGGFAVNVAAPAAAAISPRQLPGDANMDGEVNFSDFTILASNFGRAGDASHADGDFDRDRDVDFSDFLILALDFNRPRDPGSVHSPPLRTAAVDLSLADAIAGQTGAGLADALESAIADLAGADGGRML